MALRGANVAAPRLPGVCPMGDCGESTWIQKHVRVGLAHAPLKGSLEGWPGSNRMPSAIRRSLANEVRLKYNPLNSVTLYSNCDAARPSPSRPKCFLIGEEQ